MIDLGGQVAAGSGASESAAWPVAMAHPDDRHRELFEVAFHHGSLSTSGRSQRDRDAGGVRIGHILDPRTGRPASFDGSVSVWHPRALVADILSTALFVMGPEHGLAWASERGIAVCYLFASPPDEPRRVMNEAFRMAVLSSIKQ
jgi:thiamine biosynthesis lipoprotein